MVILKTDPRVEMARSRGKLTSLDEILAVVQETEPSQLDSRDVTLANKVRQYRPGTSATSVVVA